MPQGQPCTVLLCVVAFLCMMSNMQALHGVTRPELLEDSHWQVARVCSHLQVSGCSSFS